MNLKTLDNHTLSMKMYNISGIASHNRFFYEIDTISAFKKDFLQDQLLLPEPHSSTSYGSLSMEGHSVNQDVQEDERFGLLWIFLYMYLTRVWGTIRYIIFLTHDGSSYRSFFNKFDDGLFYLQSIGDSAQAFVNFLGFVVLPKWKNFTENRL